MRFLVDESIGNRFAELLKNAGYDVVFSGDAMPQVADEKVLSFSAYDKRVLITADKDFGNLVFKLKIHVNGVILFRVLTRDPEKRLEMVKDILDKAEGKFIVVSEGRIRLREL